MKTQQTFYVIKNLWTGLFWHSERKQWMLPNDRIDVLMLALANESDTIISVNEDWEDALNTIPQNDHVDCILSTITIETSIIF